MKNSNPLAVVFVAIYNLINGLVSVSLGLMGVFLFPFIPEMEIELFESYFHFLVGIGLLTSALGLWGQQSWSRPMSLVVMLFPALLTPLWLSETNAAAVNQLVVVGAVVDIFLLLMLWNKPVGEWIERQPHG